MSPVNELTNIVADAQKQTLTALKEAGSLSLKAYHANLDLAERLFAYQREAVARYTGPANKA